MVAPVNVKLARPNVEVNGWPSSEALWTQLNDDILGNPDFFPLTVKAAYVIGVIHSLCESVSCLLQHLPATVSLLPAFGVFASGVDILGRCLNGNDHTSGAGSDLSTGFNWIATLRLEADGGTVVMRSNAQQYTVADLVQLRHFAAHGQATTNSVAAQFDPGILEPMPRILAKGLEGYWSELQRSEDLCNRLAKANVLALRSWPVFRSWSLFEMKPDGTYSSISEIFGSFVWRARST